MIAHRYTARQRVLLRKCNCSPTPHTTGLLKFCAPIGQGSRFDLQCGLFYMRTMMTNEAAELSCQCRGTIPNCLFCAGTGVTTPARQTEAQQILAQSCVLQCPACGQQNRVLLERLQLPEPLPCFRCAALLLRRVASLGELLAPRVNLGSD
jgi:hypothetical protein